MWSYRPSWAQISFQVKNYVCLLVTVTQAALMKQRRQKKHPARAKATGLHSQTTAKAQEDILPFANLTGALLGIFSPTEKLPRHRWRVVHRIVKKYRGRNSLWFLVKHALWRVRNIELESSLKPIYLILTQKTEYELRQLTAIYRGLEQEKGKLIASAATVEIARAVTAWEKKQQQPKQKSGKKV